ncbi:related to O-methylsterigmatocystin oxidoreductase [Cephalotrichum gorgonifer]|uniref:Related to O-methylsterigmatocystin oxidoreductase n=1 Tax=Cephalotrichum gorgonifer TaxID=2041049 RepID=A0AAE8N5V7_9PEZI|nr:related to O-methylsterigmatocystin oxidoreductase [Cephalotrichum gorgonifer]
MCALSTPSWIATALASLPESSLTKIIAGLSVSAAAMVIRYILSTIRTKDFPPGPPTFPGIGNLHQIPLEQPFIKFHEWSKVYGDIIGLKIGPNNIVVLHSAKYVRELLDKRGAIYSGRPYSHIPAEHVFKEHGDKHILNLQYGPYLKRWRSAIAYLVGPAGVKQTLPMQEMTSATLLHQLLVEPAGSLNHLKNWALATPLLAITGQRLEDRGQEFADRFFEAQHNWLGLLEPGNAPPVDLIPALRWVPERWADWKTKARFVREYMIEEYDHFFQTASGLASKSKSKDTATCGEVTSSFPSLMTKILEDQDHLKEGERPLTAEEIGWMGGGLVDAAVDTTWATVMSFIMFFAQYPEVQAKAQEEIDRVYGDKPASGEDLDNLLYLRASMLEVFRLRPPAPNGLPHVLTRDDVFEGYKIPKGTTILTNIWGMQRNPDDYDEPEKFMPERYLNNPSGLKAGIEATDGKKPTYTFGAGRRICPGEAFAYNSVLLVMAKLLWAFKIIAPEPLDISEETGFNTGLVLGPKPFNVNFVPRDETKKRGIIADLAARTAAMDGVVI